MQQLKRQSASPLFSLVSFFRQCPLWSLHLCHDVCPDGGSFFLLLAEDPSLVVCDILSVKRYLSHRRLYPLNPSYRVQEQSENDRGTILPTSQCTSYMIL